MDAATNKQTQAFEGLIKGYEQRVNTVLQYMTAAADLLGQLRGQQDTMIAQLRDMLAEQRSMRRRDFDTLVSRMISERRRRLEALPTLIKEFGRAEQAVLGKLRELLQGNADDVARAWPELKREIQFLHRMRERNVSRALKRVHIEQEELCRGLRGLLAKGERVRIGDLKAVVREVNAISPQGLVDLAGVLRDCRSACAEVSEAWQKVV